MVRIFHTKVLAALIVCLFSLGYSHQVFGKYIEHDHIGDHHHEADDNSTHDNHEENSSGQPDDSESFSHHEALAIFAYFVPSLAVNLIGVERFTDHADSWRDALPPSIDHPPQLA